MQNPNFYENNPAAMIPNPEYLNHITKNNKPSGPLPANHSLLDNLNIKPQNQEAIDEAKDFDEVEIDDDDIVILVHGNRNPATTAPLAPGKNPITVPLIGKAYNEDIYEEIPIFEGANGEGGEISVPTSTELVMGRQNTYKKYTPDGKYQMVDANGNQVSVNHKD
jgi:hypothetical protein